MKKTKVLLATFSNPYYLWLPYSVGCLISHVKKNPVINKNYDFLTPLFKPNEYNFEDYKDVKILGLTNYVWNQGYNDEFAVNLKKANPDITILYGGPNIPEREEEQIIYSSNRTFVDHFFIGPGEKIFEQFLISNLSHTPEAIPNTFKVNSTCKPVTKKNYELNPPPTPYLDNIFDEYLKNDTSSLGMIIETNRGCPFQCAFCDWGSLTKSKINKFNHEEVLESVKKVLPYENIKRLYIADANFGLFSENLELIKSLATLKSSLKKHFYLDFCAAKNSSKYLEDILLIVHNKLEDKSRKNYRISVQSHSEKVLKINNRSNIKMDNFYKLVKRVGAYRPSSELIIGLPGETKESWLLNFQKEVDLKTGFTRAYKLQALVNTPMKEPNFIKKYSIKEKKFLIPLDLVQQNLSEYDNMREYSFETYSKSKQFIEFNTITSCFSYSINDLEEMYSIWYWYSLLSNSGLAFDEIRKSKFSITEQYKYFKESLPNMTLFNKIWEWQHKSFQQIFKSKSNVINSVENVNYIIKSPKYLAEIYNNIEIAISELKSIYPNITKDGILNIEKSQHKKLYLIDAIIREKKIDQTNSYA